MLSNIFKKSPLSKKSPIKRDDIVDGRFVVDTKNVPLVHGSDVDQCQYVTLDDGSSRQSDRLRRCRIAGNDYYENRWHYIGRYNFDEKCSEFLQEYGEWDLFVVWGRETQVVAVKDETIIRSPLESRELLDTAKDLVDSASITSMVH